MVYLPSDSLNQKAGQSDRAGLLIQLPYRSAASNDAMYMHVELYLVHVRTYRSSSEYRYVPILASTCVYTGKRAVGSYLVGRSLHDI